MISGKFSPSVTSDKQRSRYKTIHFVLLFVLFCLCLYVVDGKMTSGVFRGLLTETHTLNMKLKERIRLRKNQSIVEKTRGIKGAAIRNIRFYENS